VIIVVRFRYDAEFIRLLKTLLAGVWIKTIGYVTIGAGIFMGAVNEEAGKMTILIGATFVIVGWMLVYKALKLSKSGR